MSSEQQNTENNEKRGRGRNPRDNKKPRQNQTGEKKDWIPVTKLGRLVKEGYIKSLEEIYKFSIPIKEVQIIDYFLKDLKDEVMGIKSVQKQTTAGQRTCFKAVVAVGDSNGHVGLGIKVSKEVAIAIKGAITNAKMTIVPVRRGYWGNKIGKVHTVPVKVHGKSGSVMVRLVPAPRGSGIVAAPVPKKLLALAGVDDVFTQSTGKTKTAENFVKATFFAVKKTYGFLTPDLWEPTVHKNNPFQEFSDLLSKKEKKL
jgi:small subunit ribosomal protein S2e